MIRVLIVDDQHLVREGLKSLLHAQADMAVVGAAENGRQALEIIAQTDPEVLLLDVRMPQMDGVAVVQAVQQQWPQIRILMLSTFDHDEYVHRAMQYGAKGYLLKDTHPDILAAAIRSVYQGHTHLGPGLFEKMMHSPPTGSSAQDPIELPPGWSELTGREKEVLSLIAQGASNREIAQTLYISEKTVKNHITHIFSRLNLRDRVQAALMASTLLEFLDPSRLDESSKYQPETD